MRKGSRKFSNEEIITALVHSGGVIASAAGRLGCDRTTVKRYLKNPLFANAMHDARESFKDLAENRLMTAVKNGNLTAIIFTLKTLAKDRGYNEFAERDDKQTIQFKISQDEADY